MTLSAAISGIARAEERLRDMIAACAAFQQWVGADTQAEAKTRVHLFEVPQRSIGGEGEDGTFSPEEIAYRRPFALVWTGDTESYAIDFIASPATPNPSGVLHVRLEEDVPEELADNYREAYRRFLNTVGLIMQSNEQHSPGLRELLTLQHPDHLAISRITLVKSPIRTTEDDVPTLGDAHYCELRINWGASA